MDPVNKVIAAILDADLSGGKKSRSRKRSEPAHGVMGAFQSRVRALAGGRDISGGHDIAALEAPVPAAVVPAAPAEISAGRKKRTLNSALKRHHALVMQRYDAIRRSPRTRNLPGNEALRLAMRTSRSK